MNNTLSSIAYSISNNNNRCYISRDWNTYNVSTISSENTSIISSIPTTSTPTVHLTIQARLEKNLLAIGGEPKTAASSALVFQRMLSSPSESTQWFRVDTNDTGGNATAVDSCS